MPTLATLPVALARRVLLCAVDAPEENPSNREFDMGQAFQFIAQPELRLPRPTATIASLQQLARVSKPWRMLARDAASEIALGRYTVRMQKPTRQAMLELRRELALRRAYLKSVVFAQVPTDEEGFGRKAGAIQEAQWAAALSHAPLVEDVNLEVLKTVDLD